MSPPAKNHVVSAWSSDEGSSTCRHTGYRTNWPASMDPASMKPALVSSLTSSLSSLDRVRFSFPFPVFYVGIYCTMFTSQIARQHTKLHWHDVDARFPAPRTRLRSAQTSYLPPCQFEACKSACRAHPILCNMQFGTSAFNMVVRWRELDEVENEYILHNCIAYLPSFCRKLSKLVNIWRSSDRKKQFCSFFETRCIHVVSQRVSVISCI